MKKNKQRTVYVVPCVDVEGPLSDKKLSDLYDSWERIDKSLKIIFSRDYRNANPDSFKGHLIFSWFMLDFTGFKTNPRKRDWGYHKVHDHYAEKWGRKIKKYGDGIYWHYHHPPKSGIGIEWNCDWLSNTEYEYILTRKLIDRGFFPSVFRAGGTIETNDTSEWLEKWIPFDYSNRNSKNTRWNRLEADGRPVKDVADWRLAPDNWSTYHPNHKNYQLRGDMKRLIVRSLDIYSGAHVLTQDEVDEAFSRAATGKETILSFFCHDFREMGKLNNSVIRMIQVSAKKFKAKWRYANALEAIKRVKGFRYQKGPEFRLKVKNGILMVSSSKPLFGPQPYLAIKYENGEYIHPDFTSIGRDKWVYEIKKVNQIIGIASNDSFGNTEVALYEYSPKNGLNVVESKRDYYSRYGI
jgi:hypothetical protein